MSKEVRISVVITAYNSRDTIEKCIKSCFPIPRDTEILVINDGSTDETSEIVKRLQSGTDCIRLIDCRHMGHGSARMNGIKEAKGDYILFVDSDDFLCKGAINDLLKETEKLKNDIIVFSFYYWADLENCYKPYVETEKIRDKESLFVYATSYFWNKLIRKDMLENLRIENMYGEDDAAVLPLLIKSNRYTVLSKQYYYHTTSEKALSNNKRVVSDIPRSYAQTVQNIKKSDLYEQYKTVVYRLFYDRRNVFLDMLRYRFSDEEIDSLERGFQAFFSKELPELAEVIQWNYCFSGVPTDLIPWAMPFHCRLCEIDIFNLIHLIESQDIKDFYAVVFLKREMLKVKLGIDDEETVIRDFISRFHYLIKLMKNRSGKGITVVVSGKEDKDSSFYTRITSILEREYNNKISVIYPTDYYEYMNMLIEELIKLKGVPQDKDSVCDLKQYDYVEFSNEYRNSLIKVCNGTFVKCIDILKKKRINSVAIYGVTNIAKILVNEVKEAGIRKIGIFDKGKAGGVVEDYAVELPELINDDWDIVIVTPFYIYDSIFFYLLVNGVQTEKIFSVDELVLS